MSDKPSIKQNHTVSESASITAAAGRIPGAAKEILWTTPVGEGLFWTTVGNMTEEIIRNYIANQENK